MSRQERINMAPSVQRLEGKTIFFSAKTTKKNYSLQCKDYKERLQSSVQRLQRKTLVFSTKTTKRDGGLQCKDYKKTVVFSAKTTRID